MGKAKGDCGEGPIGGINKDTWNETFSPRDWLHGAAAASATDATKAFLRYIAGRIGNGQLNDTNSHLRQLLGVGPDLAIVIGVCGDRLASYESSITNVVNARLETEQEPVRYVLVPFTDLGNGNDVVLPPYVTDDSTAFLNAVDALTIDATGGGTGDCPSVSMQATLLGLGKANEGANLFLITEVPPKDYYKVGAVVSLAREKEIKIYPMVFATCWASGPYNSSAYDLIASGDDSSGGGSGGDSGGGSGGQAFHGDFCCNSNITGYINALTRTNGVDILAVSDTTSQSYTIPIDSSVTRLVFSLTHAPRVSANNYTPLTLTRPDGTPVRSTDSGVNFKYFSGSLGDPESGGIVITIATTTIPTGNWIAEINNQPSGNRFHLNVTGDSSLQLNRFTLAQDTSGLPHPGYFDIDGFPRAGQTIKGVAQLDGSFSTANFELRSRTGTPLGPSLNFSPDVAGSNEFFGDVLIPPVPFLAYVKGSLSDETQYQRVSAKDFAPQSVTVTAPPEQVGYVGLPVNYNFTVTNYGPAHTFNGLVADDKSPTWVNGHGFTDVFLGTNEETTIAVQLNVPNDTPAGTLNYLNVSFAAGGYNFTGVKNYATVKTLVVPEPNGTFGLIACVGFLVLLHQRRKLYC